MQIQYKNRTSRNIFKTYRTLLPFQTIKYLKAHERACKIINVKGIHQLTTVLFPNFHLRNIGSLILKYKKRDNIQT